MSLKGKSSLRKTESDNSRLSRNDDLAEGRQHLAQYKLAVPPATGPDPAELEEARRRFTAAAEAGDVDAQYSLKRLIATQLDLPEFEEARR
jgi:uncharacterized protein